MNHLSRSSYRGIGLSFIGAVWGVEASRRQRFSWNVSSESLLLLWERREMYDVAWREAIECLLRYAVRWTDNGTCVSIPRWTAVDDVYSVGNRDPNTTRTFSKGAFFNADLRFRVLWWNFKGEHAFHGERRCHRFVCYWSCWARLFIKGWCCSLRLEVVVLLLQCFSPFFFLFFSFWRDFWVVGDERLGRHDFCARIFRAW